MPLHLLTAEQVQMMAGCPRCGVATGQPCDPEQLRPTSTVHVERMRAARDTVRLKAVGRASR